MTVGDCFRRQPIRFVRVHPDSAAAFLPSSQKPTMKPVTPLVCRRVTLCMVAVLLPFGCSLRAEESAIPGSVPVVAPALPASSLFVARYVSVYTPHGMFGFVPGCPVRLVRRDGKLDRLTVTDGQYEVEVNSTQVTDDPAVAATLRRQSLAEDQAALAALASRRPFRGKPALPAPATIRTPPPPISLLVSVAASPANPPATTALAYSPAPRVPSESPRESPPHPLLSPSSTPLPALSPPPPAGTLFLCEYASIRWEHGVVGFSPGQPVRLVNTNVKTGKMLVTDGRFQIEVPPTKLTTNANLAGLIQRQDEAEQLALKATCEATQLADEMVHRRHEAALQRIEFDRDLELAGLVKDDGGVGTERLGLDPNAPVRSLYDRPYGLRGDPYRASHTDVPRWTGPHSQPGSLEFGSNGLGFY